MQTPQRATVEATADGDLVMRGVNGDGAGTTADGRPMTGALRFEARVRVLADRRHARRRGRRRRRPRCRRRHAARRRGDQLPQLRRRQRRSGRARRGGARSARRARASTRCAPRTSATTSSSSIASRSISGRRQRAPDRRARARIRATAATRSRRALLPVRPLSADRQLAARSQPANLQGIWNDSMSPPWGSKYTININTEMNYWPALSTNLAETMEPLTAMVTDLSVTGARTAREMYGARGWVAHHNTDLWRATGADRRTAMGHVADRRRVAHAGAVGSLRVHRRPRAISQRIYPLLKGAAQFFLDTLVEEPTHRWLVTSPSLSPENPHPFGTSLTMGPTMDSRSCATCSPTRSTAARDARRRSPICRSVDAPRARGSRRTRSAAPASCRNGSRTGTCRRRRSTTGTCRTCTASFPGTTSTCAARRNSPPRSSARSRFAATRPRAGPPPGGSTSGRGWATATAPTRS